MRSKIQNKLTKYFDGKCIAEIFKMEKYNDTDYVKGAVLLEVIKKGKKENYTVYRKGDGEFYEVILETSDKDLVAEELFSYSDYRSIGWYIPYNKMISSWQALNAVGEAI